MSEEKAPFGPRSNPLYGGSSGGTNSGGRTPSWARRTAPSPKHSVFSDVASTPPDSPAREPFNQAYNTPTFEYPGYSVETPYSDSAANASPYPSSPYHAPPYYVQTPAQSDPGVPSPFSSAPSSPAHFAYGSDSDTRSQRSTKAGSRASRLAQVNMGKIDEEDEEYPDLERDRQRLAKQYTCATWICIIFLALTIVIGSFVAWGIFKPEPPRYKFLGVTVSRFDLMSTSFDGHGVTTASIYGNVTGAFSASNPNSNFNMHYDSTYFAVGYSNLVIMEGEVSPFEVYPDVLSNYTASAVGWNYPLYAAGPFLADDVNVTFVNLTIKAVMKSHVSVFWKVLRPKYEDSMLCTIGVNSTTLQVINSTCLTAFE